MAITLAIGATQAGAASIEEADAAFDAGDTEQALTLYDAVLEGDPGNVQALVRSGMLLSWDRRYDDAIARYDRALAVEPDNPTALLERAKVLSWDQQYRAAADGFRKILEREPANREARLGLARCLSWSGDPVAARSEYEALLRSTPNDPEIVVGLAQTQAWSGDLGNARSSYEDALRIDPGNRDAEMGLAYVDLWSGQDWEADRRARDLHARYPEDHEVDELLDAIDRARAPWVRLGWDRVDDTDGNTWRVWRLDTGFGLTTRLDARVGVAHHDLTNDPLDANIDTVEGAIDYRPARRHLLTFRAGADWWDPPSGDHHTEPIGGVAWTMGVGEAWRTTLFWSHETLRYSPEILAAGVVIDAFDARVEGSFAGAWRTSIGANLWEVSGTEDNQRFGADGAIWYRWPVKPFAFESGFVTRYLDWDEDLDDGYFDPQHFTSYTIQLRARDDFGPGDRAYWDVMVEGGVQSFTLRDQGVEVNNDTLLGGAGTLGLPLTERLDLEAYAAYSDSAVQAPSGFRSRQFGLRLRWRFLPRSTPAPIEPATEAP